VAGLPGSRPAVANAPDLHRLRGHDYNNSPIDGLKILVVDDDYRNVFAMTAFLERARAAVTVVDSGAPALAEGLIGFAEGLGATVVAEGIETQAELDTLRELGVALGQGFSLSLRDRCRSSGPHFNRRRGGDRSADQASA
jgi:predicted signal transduction protein with EAL and GGDEF domain